MSPIVSDNSLVEGLGPPPPAITAEQEAKVRKLIEEAFPNDSSAPIRAEMEAMLFDDTTVGYAPAAAPWHPAH